MFDDVPGKFYTVSDVKKLKIKNMLVMFSTRFLEKNNFGFRSLVERLIPGHCPSSLLPTIFFFAIASKPKACRYIIFGRYFSKVFSTQPALGDLQGPKIFGSARSKDFSQNLGPVQKIFKKKKKTRQSTSTYYECV